MNPSREIADYYDAFPEESRLETGPFRLEFARTKEILTRVLPPPPAAVVDVGGAAGTYSAWLAGRGYEVHLVDVSARLVEIARQQNRALDRAIASLSVADARQLPQHDASAAAVLVMGPLYHLTDASDRRKALLEAWRVLVPGGRLVVAAVSRYASALDGLSRGLAVDPEFVRMRDRDLQDGQHRNVAGRIDYFTTAYFHRPEDLRQEVEAAGFVDVEVLGVEGPGWMLPDFDTRWADAALRADMLNVARAVEAEPSIVGASAHLLSVGSKPSH
jgi:ubiquinone/menaquinone biosynthesis C-methylase UbiE